MAFPRNAHDSPSVFMRASPALLLTVVILSGAPSRATTFESPETQASLIELYTSEGCSSCPPAEARLTKLRDNPGLWSQFVPVAFHVDYWDKLGWPDRFASGVFTRRQYQYAARWGGSSVYTPEFVLQRPRRHRAVTRGQPRPAARRGAGRTASVAVNFQADPPRPRQGWSSNWRPWRAASPATCAAAKTPGVISRTISSRSICSTLRWRKHDFAWTAALTLPAEDRRARDGAGRVGPRHQRSHRSAGHRAAGSNPDRRGRPGMPTRDRSTAHPTVLVVDDTPANLSVLLDLLTGAGFAVLVADGGERALLQVRHTGGPTSSCSTP